MTQVGSKHWVRQKNETIERLKQELDLERKRPIARAFIQRVMESTFTILANKPFDQWPDEAKLAFKHEEDETPTAAYLYKKCNGWID